VELFTLTFLRLFRVDIMGVQKDSHRFVILWNYSFSNASQPQKKIHVPKLVRTHGFTGRVRRMGAGWELATRTRTHEYPWPNPEGKPGTCVQPYRGENWIEAETGRKIAVLIHRWSTYPLNNTGVLLTGSCLIIGKETWCAHR
jgi:hypothetical protein